MSDILHRFTESKLLKNSDFLTVDTGDIPPMPEYPDDEQAPKRARYVIRNADFALQPQPPIDWKIEGLISAGSVTLIVGAPGTGKTYATLSAAVSVALGKGWLGFKTSQSRALIVDEESGERRLARRLGAVIRGEMGNENTPIDFVSLAQFNLREPTDGVLLYELIKATGAGFVVIDALVDIMPGADENAVKDVHPVFQTLRKIADETQAAIILIHHANKVGGYRGSTAMSGAVDLMLMVEKKEDDPIIDFKTVKARDIEPLTFAAKAHFSDGQVWLSPCEPKGKTQFTGKAESYVLRFLESQGGTASMDDIKNNADVCSEESARRAVYDLANKNLVRRSNPGEKGSKSIWTIKPDPEALKAAERQLSYERENGHDLSI